MIKLALGHLRLVALAGNISVFLPLFQVRDVVAIYVRCFIRLQGEARSAVGIYLGVAGVKKPLDAEFVSRDLSPSPNFRLELDGLALQAESLNRGKMN